MQIIFVIAINEKLMNPIVNKKSNINVCAVVIFNLQHITRGIRKPRISIRIDLKHIKRPPKHKQLNNIVVSNK